MSTTVSVSKGVFVFKNGAKSASKSSRNKKKPREESLFCDNLWYRTYKSLWKNIESKIQELNDDMFSNVLSNLIKYLKQSYKDTVTEIPGAALLTGINMPDHSAQFKTLTRELKESITPHVVTLNGEDCQSLKYLVETMILQLVKNEDELDEDESDSKKVKKSQCNFTMLQSWYEDLYSYPALNKSPKKQKTKTNKKMIVVIIPDFENFSPKVLQDFILIASSYINVLPFVFVFGIATSITAVHRSIPCHVSSKISIQVFHSSPSTVYLNKVLENILFSPDCPFHLGGKVFNLFSDVFLFYDLSVSGFIQNFKYAMLEHFSYGNAMALCQRKHIKQIIENFSHNDLENARRLLSFRKLVESEPFEARIKLLTDDQYFRNTLKREIREIMRYLPNLHLFLRCLHILVHDLPKAPLGKQVRELYAFAVSKNITKSQEYKECFQLLAFQSREELYSKVRKIKDLITNNDHSVSITEQLDKYLKQMDDLDLEDGDDDVEISRKDVLIQLMDRMQLKETLKQMSHNKPLNKYEKIRSKLLDFLSRNFEMYLLEPASFYFHEIFFFNDISIQTHIIGSHRAAIHTALNDPHYYLQCQCCDIPNDSVILPSMPDISIVYKLHLECGKMINLYDWLQSFLSIVDPQELEDDEKPNVRPEMQARFTQAVAELEYLGFIKSSKRKTDHVQRLTWGG